VHISIAVNSGIFFRLADDLLWPGKPYLLAGLSLTPALMIVWWRMRPAPGREPLLTALALIAGGLLGNSADRILHGAVIDFIEVHIEGSVYYPTFNFADLAITAGMILILADALVSRARTHGLPGPLP
jgi:signal peptidase II